MEMLLERASVKRAAKAQSRREVLDHLDFTEKQLQLITVEMKDKICKMVEEVEHKVRMLCNFLFLSAVCAHFNDFTVNHDLFRCRKL